MKVLTDKQKNDVLMCALVAALKQSLNCEEAVAVEAAVLLFIVTRQAMFPEASHEQVQSLIDQLDEVLTKEERAA